LGTAVITVAAGDTAKYVNVTVTADGLSGTELFRIAAGYWLAENLGVATVGTDLTFTLGTVELVDGPSETKKAIQMTSREHGLLWEHGITGDGLKTFTIMLDAWIPLLPDRAYYPVYWNTSSPSASMFLRSRDGDLTLNRRGGTHGSFVVKPTAGEEPWTRIVIQYKYDANSNSYDYRNFANGVQIYQSGDGNSDSDLIEGQPVWFLYGPGTGDNNPYKVAAIAVWDRALTPEQIASLGGVGNY
jgi:hypothetical protein